MVGGGRPLLRENLGQPITVYYRITGLGYLKFMATLNIGHDMMNYSL